MPSGPTGASASTSPDQKPEPVLPDFRYAPPVIEILVAQAPTCQRARACGCSKFSRSNAAIRCRHGRRPEPRRARQRPTMRDGSRWRQRGDVWRRPHRCPSEQVRPVADLPRCPSSALHIRNRNGPFAVESLGLTLASDLPGAALLIPIPLSFLDRRLVVLPCRPLITITARDART